MISRADPMDVEGGPAAVVPAEVVPVGVDRVGGSGQWQPHEACAGQGRRETRPSGSSISSVAPMLEGAWSPSS